MLNSAVRYEHIKMGLTPERLLAIVSVIGSICILGWLLWYCHYGFDFTDEGFYLNWISHPFNYSASLSQFGFLYHPLYQLVGGDIAALRQANVMLNFCLGWSAGWALLSRIFGVRTLSVLPKFAISAGMASSGLLSLVFAGMWLPTPSYNSLAFQGLLITAAGLFLVDKTSSRASMVGCVLIGVGGWLVFMGKPTSAAALALICALYLLLAGKPRVTPLTIATCTAIGLVILSALTMDGSVTGFGERLKEGMRIANLLDSNSTFERLFRLEELVLDQNTKLLLFSVVALVFLSFWLAWGGNGRFSRSRGILSAAVVLVGLAALLRIFPLSLISGQYRGLLLCAVPFGGVVAGLSAYRIRGLLKIKWTQWILFFSILVFPYAYAFGTGNSYWIPIAGGGIFLTFAGVILLAPIASQARLPIILISLSLSIQVISAALINQGFMSPYRQPMPLRQNDSAMGLGWPRTILVLAKTHAQYLSAAADIARQSGFKQGTPMIDLSGQSPGVVYALGANAVGVAWTLGGYPGSNQFVIDGLKSVSCDQLAVAWFLAEPHGIRPISPDVLSTFGAELTKDFLVVGTLTSPEGQIQQLYKPARDVDAAKAACVAAKRSDV